MTRAPGLVRYAARYAGSVHDAEDAYQRAMEIALTRAPVTEDPRFLAWLHTVLRNEALAIARARRREVPSETAVVAHIDRAADADGPQRSAETRERWRAIQDALGGLTEAQRLCLMLQIAGASYSAICDITGFTRRKVERSVLEGRANLHAWEVRLDQGGVCAEVIAAMDRVMAGAGDRADGRAVRRHTRHCRACRTALRTRRQSDEWLAALVPPALLAGAEAAPAADPTPLLACWERASGSLGLRSAQLMQLGTELYAVAASKVGLGAAALAVAGAAGGPLLVGALGPSAEPAPGPAAHAAVTASAPPTVPGSALGTTVTAAPPRRPAQPRARSLRTPARPAPPRPAPAATRAPTTAPVPARAARPPPSHGGSASPPAPPSPSLVLEFGP